MFRRRSSANPPCSSFLAPSFTALACASLGLLTSDARATSLASIVDGAPVIDEDGGGRKRWAAMQVLTPTNDAGILQLTDPAGANSCFGDSGGPIFTLTEQGELRVLAIVRSGNVDPEDCGTLTDATDLTPEATAWFEAAAGLDLTPCFDAAGSWDPSEACARLGASPESSSGSAPSWDDGCAEAYAVEFSASCGPALDDGAGDESGDDDSSSETSSGTAGPGLDPAEDVGGQGCACTVEAHKGARSLAGLLLLLTWVRRARPRRN